MIATSGRLLRLLTLLSSRPTWTNAELARRLEVTERTVRRDVDRLRELGYGVESAPGPGGGYRLSAGTRVPPLSLDDDEAFAVAVALREAAHGTVLGGDQASLSALLKLQRLLPRRMAARLADLDAAVEHTPRAPAAEASPAVLLTLASVCRATERTELAYQDMHGRTTVREVDPHRLVYTGAHWYFVARDVVRDAWRTFRADRVTAARPTGVTVDLPDPPDAARLVADTITRTGYPFYARVRLPLPMEEALRLVPPIVATHEPESAHSTIVTIGGSDPDATAGYLLGLRTPVEVLSPTPVRDALLSRLDALYRANADDRPPTV
ncbi:YafY family protein [Streptomyces sp. CRN 30]|uniref:helix-turn-helix transcriptional regulator n=1 Tax=Streptomyces sp. CRN 30 TaxID=3075613 RepID=UPI002A8317FD|nr:YafY family protein [Streptomyces sp. CRN 30]